MVECILEHDLKHCGFVRIITHTAVNEVSPPRLVY